MTAATFAIIYIAFKRIRIATIAVSLLVLLVLHFVAQPASAGEPAFLWVIDQNTGLGVPGASVAIGPGKACVGLTDPQIPNWTAHYVTDTAGRVSLQSRPSEFSCRVERHGRVLQVVSAGGFAARPGTGPKWMGLRHASEISLTVKVTPLETQDDLHYWEHTSDPARFRAYVEDLDNGTLLSGVIITARHSGTTTNTDENGLFTLDIPAQYWKGVSPPGAMDTLVISKAGYKRYEYRNLILFPGLKWLDIYLEEGNGKVVRENGGRGGMTRDEFFELKAGQREKPDPKKGQILSLTIEPATYEGGWIVCTAERAKAIVKTRNLKSVDIFWYSTGTGIGLMPPAKAGPMEKVSTSAEADTWEIEMPDLMATNFWAQGTDATGKVVKSMDLGNVGWNVNP